MSGIFSAIPNPPSTDELVNNQFASGRQIPVLNPGVPTGPQAPQAPQGLIPMPGYTINKPATVNQQAEVERQKGLSEDSIMSHLSALNPAQAELFMEKINQRLLFQKYRETIIGCLDTNFNCLHNPQQQIVLIFLDSTETTQTVTFIPYNAISSVKADSRVYTEIVTMPTEDTAVILRQWLDDVEVNFVSPLVATYNSLLGIEPDIIEQGDI